MFRKLLKTGELKLWKAYKDYQRNVHPLTYLFWECTLNCNFFCKHCGSSAGRKVYQDELTTKEIKKTFKEIAHDFDARRIMLAITGGEPLLRKDLIEVMSYAHSLGFSWGMVTNGFLLTEDKVQQLKDAGMNTVVVSIDGIGKTHDNFRNTPGAYEQAVNAVKLLAKAHFVSDLQITTSVHKDNIKELEIMHETYVPLGITSWRVFNVDPIGRAEDNYELLLDAEQLKHLLDFIKTKRKSSPVKVTYGCAGFLGLDYEKAVRNHYFNCNTGINTASILHNGDIFVCPNVPRRQELIQGNVRKKRFSKIWNTKFEIFRKPDRTACKQCKTCSYWEECLGSSYHLWDFEKKQPKFCHMRMIGEC